MTRKRRRSPSVVRARQRQANGDPRPLMIILQEERVSEVRKTGDVKSKPTTTIKSDLLMELEDDQDA